MGIVKDGVGWNSDLESGLPNKGTTRLTPEQAEKAIADITKALDARGVKYEAQAIGAAETELCPTCKGKGRVPSTDG